MNVAAYKEIWNQLAPSINVELNSLRNSLIESGLGSLAAQEVTLETNAEEFFGSLVFTSAKCPVPVISVDLRLAELSDDADKLYMQFCVSSFEIVDGVCDFETPTENSFRAHVDWDEPASAEYLEQQSREAIQNGIHILHQQLELWTQHIG